MKYAIIIPDGCADEPQEALHGKTPLQAARTPEMDRLAATGIVGRANHVPLELPPGSDVANLSLLGYDPQVHFTGRAPLEAAAQGIPLGPHDWAVRCNLVCIQDQTMRDFTAGHISTGEATELLRSAQEVLTIPGLQFFPGVSYRNLLVVRGEQLPVPFSRDTRSTPPHDLTDKPILDDYPRGPGCDLLCDLMQRSQALFSDHPVNRRRLEQNLLPASHVWLWGLGKAPQLPLFRELHQLQGVMITAVDLLRGLGALIGWPRIHVPGATGYLDTDYAAKGRAAVDALASNDLVCVHIEAPDEASHEGNVSAKMEALEQIDRHIVGPVHAALRSHGEYRIMVSPDHPTPVRTKTHSHGFVPFVVAGSGVVTGHSNHPSTYDEVTAGQSTLAFPVGWQWMSTFLHQPTLSATRLG